MNFGRLRPPRPFLCRRAVERSEAQARSSLPTRFRELVRCRCRSPRALVVPVSAPNSHYDPLAHALASTLNYEKSHFDKLVASLLPLMEKLTTGRTASLLSPELDDPTD